jgi:endonuclease YncB( thermonuclease family)
MIPVIALFVVAFTWSAAAQDAAFGRASVVDGDSLEIQGIRIRLYGIDAPESSQFCTLDHIAYRRGQRTAFALADKIGTRPVSCSRRDTDRYGRMVAVCRAGGEDLNSWMVEQGHAIAFRRYSMAYVPIEDAARIAKRGLWAGEFQSPDVYRREARMASRQRVPYVRRACTCPADLDSVGHRCGRRSAYSRSGGMTAVCRGRM